MDNYITYRCDQRGQRRTIIIIRNDDNVEDDSGKFSLFVLIIGCSCCFFYIIPNWIELKSFRMPNVNGCNGHFTRRVLIFACLWFECLSIFFFALDFDGDFFFFGKSKLFQRNDFFSPVSRKHFYI